MKKILSSVLLLIGALTASITVQSATPNGGGWLTDHVKASNTATYTITAVNGSIVYGENGLIIERNSNSSNPNSQFAFLSPTHDGSCYMYSLGAKQFVTYDEGNNLTFSNNPAKIYPIIFKPAGTWYGVSAAENTDQMVFINFPSLNKNIVFDKGNIVLGTWGWADEGCVYLVEEVDTDNPDLADALDILENTCNVTFELYDGDTNGSPIATETQLQRKNSPAVIPASLTTSDWYDYTTEGTIGNATTATIKVIRTVKSNILKSVSDLRNDKAYQIVVPRGTFTTNNGYIANTVRNANYEVSNFAIIKSNDKYYLWSIKDKKFVSGSSDGVNNDVEGFLTSTPVEVTFVEGEEGKEANVTSHPNIDFIRINIENKTLIASAGKENGVIFATGASFDGGAACVIIEVGDFSFPVEIGEAEWSTFSAPLPITKPADVTAYTATMASEDKLELQEIEGDVIPANTGVLLNAAPSSYNFSFPTSGAEEGDEDNVLKASVGETTVTPYETYVLANGNNGLGFYLLNDVTVPAFKAYINKTDANKAAAYLSFGNSVTGLAGVEASAAEADVYYDVQGRKVVAPQKGQLYIVNGKKVLY